MISGIGFGRGSPEGVNWDSSRRGWTRALKVSSCGEVSDGGVVVDFFLFDILELELEDWGAWIC